MSGEIDDDVAVRDDPGPDPFPDPERAADENTAPAPGALSPEARRKRLTKLLIMCQAFGIERGDRIDLAQHICWRDNILSFNDLTDRELDRMLDALTGATLIAHLCLERRAGTRKQTPAQREAARS